MGYSTEEYTMPVIIESLFYVSPVPPIGGSSEGFFPTLGGLLSVGGGESLDFYSMTGAPVETIEKE